MEKINKKINKREKIIKYLVVNKDDECIKCKDRKGIDDAIEGFLGSDDLKDIEVYEVKKLSKVRFELDI